MTPKEKCDAMLLTIPKGNAKILCIQNADSTCDPELKKYWLEVKSEIEKL